QSAIESTVAKRGRNSRDISRARKVLQRQGLAGTPAVRTRIPRVRRGRCFIACACPHRAVAGLQRNCAIADRSASKRRNGSGPLTLQDGGKAWERRLDDGERLETVARARGGR